MSNPGMCSSAAPDEIRALAISTPRGLCSTRSDMPLGLKHGELVPPYGAEPSDHLGIEYSVMNYTTYIGQVGTDATEVPGSSPQSYMMDDIAALQYMYGANFSKVGQNVTYSWSPTTGQEFINNVGQGTPFQNRIFMTVWTEGANSTYDLSNFNENGSFDMRPGGSMRFSFQQLANLGATQGDVNHLAKGNVYNAELYGTDTRSELDNLKVGNGNDFIYGNDVYNTITLGNGNGNDTVQGGSGRNRRVADLCRQRQ
jgi:serralysin